jgi:hypothetical protein
MNLDNLQIGQEIKNYKELCKLLEEPVKDGGKAKEYQLKDFQRYFNFEREGRKFIIKEIYDSPLEKEDGRMFGNNSIYSNDIQNILLCVLYRLPSNEVVWSCNTLLNNLSMINSNYITARRDMDKLGEKMNIKKEYVYDFYNNTHKSLKGKLESALNILCKRSLITCEKILMVQKESVQIIKNELGTPKIENGKLCYRTFEFSDMATTEERELILKTQKETMNKLNVKDECEIVCKGLWNEYIKSVNRELNKNNIKYSFYAYRITYNKENIKEEITGEIGELFDRINLNNNIMNCLIKGATTRHENASKIFGIPQGSPTKIKNHKLRKSDTYIESNKQLVEKLIKKK